MENKPSNSGRSASARTGPRRKGGYLTEGERLAEAGITFVAVHFDGSGDEGVSEEIKCYGHRGLRLRR